MEISLVQNQLAVRKVAVEVNQENLVIQRLDSCYLEAFEII